MDDSSIAGRTEKLRREIEMIQQAERNYRNQRHHSLADREKHDKRGLRILTIREELKIFVTKRKL
jgi:hypothetical protein